MLAAVINDGFLRTGDGNVHSQRRDLHLAVHIVHLELLGHILAGVVQNLGSAGHHVHILAHISAGNLCADIRNGKALGQTDGGIAGNALCAAVINKCAAVAGDGDLTLLGILCHISHVIGDLGADHGAPADEVMICIGRDQGCNGGSAVLLDLAVHNLTVLVLAGQGTVITVVINDGVTGGNAAHAGNGELIFLAVHGQDGDLVGGMINALIKAFCVGIQLDAIGHGIDIGGGAVVVLGAVLILQRPGQAAGIANNAGRQIHSGSGDSNVVTHGIVDHDIFNAFGNILGNGAECSHQTGGIVGIVSIGVLHTVFIGIFRRGNAILQEVANGRTVRLPRIVAFISQFIGHTKANGIQLGIQSLQRIGRVLGIGVIAVAAIRAIAAHVIVVIAIAVIISTHSRGRVLHLSHAESRLAVGQHHSKLTGAGRKRVHTQQILAQTNTRIQIGTTSVGITPTGGKAGLHAVDHIHSIVIAILTCATGHIGPAQEGLGSRTIAYDGQHTGCIRIFTGIANDFSLSLAGGRAGQELQCCLLGSIQTGLGFGYGVIPPIIERTFSVMATTITALCAVLHRVRQVDGKHNSRRIGLHHSLGDGLNLQRDIEHIVRHLLGGLAQIQSKQIAHLIGKLAFAALLPLAILIVIAIGHGRKFFLPGCPNSRHGQIQNHNHCQKQRQETFSHKNSSFS